MKKQLSGIGIKQSAKFMAVLYFILSAIFCIPVGILLIIQEGFQEKGYILLVPIVYGLLTWIFTAFVAFIYNIVADMVGGLELTLKDVDETI